MKGESGMAPRQMIAQIVAKLFFSFKSVGVNMVYQQSFYPQVNICVLSYLRT